MPALLSPDTLSVLYVAADLSGLPSSNPGSGKPWLSDGIVRVGASAGSIPSMPESPTAGNLAAFDGDGGFSESTISWSGGVVTNSITSPVSNGTGFRTFVSGSPFSGNYTGYKCDGNVSNLLSIICQNSGNGLAQIQAYAVGTGDAFFRAIAGTGNYSLGIDNSDSDLLKIGPGSSPSSVTAGVHVDTSGNVYLPDLPTSDPVSSGQLWNDSGTVKVSAG